MTAVAFVGLGRMGRLMAARLVAAGHEVRGFDLDPAAVVDGVVPLRERARGSARGGGRDHDAAVAGGRARRDARARRPRRGPRRGRALHRHVDRAAGARSRARRGTRRARHRRARRARLGRHDRRRGRHADDHGGRPGGGRRARTPAVRGARHARRARRRSRSRAGGEALQQPLRRHQHGGHRAGARPGAPRGARSGRALRAAGELDGRLARPAHALPGPGHRHDSGRARLRPDVHGRPDGEGPRARRAAGGRRTASRREPLAAALALYRRAQAEGHGSLDYSAVALTTGGAEL